MLLLDTRVHIDMDYIYMKQVYNIYYTYDTSFYVI